MTEKQHPATGGHGASPENTETVLLAAALDLAAGGWCVFPCDPETKAPLTLHGFKDATTDAAKIRFWWERMRPDALIGMAVPANIVVLDVDPRHGGNEAELGPIPRTLRCWSGRGDGGCHIYFRRPFGQLTNRRLTGIDIRDAGKHYVIVPPSPHPITRQQYRWEGDSIAPMPDGLAERLRFPERLETGGGAVGEGQRLVDFVGRLAEGARNDGLFWACCRAAEAGVLASLERDLVAAAVAIGLTETEALAVVESAARTLGGAE